MQVQFLFTLDESVATPFGEQGIVSTCALDASGVVYYVKTAAGGDWFREDQLKAMQKSEIERVLLKHCGLAVHFDSVTP